MIASFIWLFCGYSCLRLHASSPRVGLILSLSVVLITMVVVSVPTGLPRDLFDVYASYKRGTARVIRWLSRIADSSDGGLGVERPYLHSVDELRYFADRIILNDVDVPDGLLRVYRQVLQARKRLTSFYTGLPYSQGRERESTERHAYFNSVFEHVFHDLEHTSSRKRRLSDYVHGTHPPPAVGVPAWGDKNSYECLAAIAELLPDATSGPREGQRLEILSVRPSIADEAAEIGPMGTPIAGDVLAEMTHLYTHLLVRHNPSTGGDHILPIAASYQTPLMAGHSS